MMQRMTRLHYYLATFIYLSVLFLVIPQLSLAQVNNEPAVLEVKKKVTPFPGKGENGGTGVYEPGTFSYSISPSHTNSDNSTKNSVELKVKYGVDLYGKDVELDCTTPWAVEKTGSNSNSGFESLTCGAKIQVYNNQESGTSASAKMSLKGSNLFGHGLSDEDTGVHIIIPVAVMQMLADGDAAVVGTVTMDHALNGSGTHFKYAAGAGTRLSSSSSISGDISYATTGKTTVDAVYGYQVSNSTLFWVKVWRSIRTSGNDETGVAAGIEVTLDKQYFNRTKCPTGMCLK